MLKSHLLVLNLLVKMEVQWKSSKVSMISLVLWKTFAIAFCLDVEYGSMSPDPTLYPNLIYNVFFLFHTYVVLGSYTLDKYKLLFVFTSLQWFVNCCLVWHSPGVQCESPKSINGRISPVLPTYYYRDVITAQCDIGYKIIIVRTNETSTRWWIAFYIKK